MIKFQKIKLKNFLSFKDIEFELDNKGTVLVLGQNDDSMYAGSNGSGKSCLFTESIFYGLFGRTLRGISPTQVITNGEKSSSVTVEFDVDGSKYKVTRTRTGVSGNLIVEQDGKDISLKDTRETQKQIIDSLMDSEITKNSIIFSGSVFESFVLLGDAQKKKIITSILGFDKLEMAKEIAKKKRDVIQNQKMKIEMKITALQDLLGELKVEITELEKVDIKSRKQDLESVSSTIKQLEEVESKLSEKINDYYQKRNEIDKHISELNSLLHDFDTNYIRNKTEVKNIQEQINSIEDLISKGKCPKCKQPIQGGELSNDIKDLQIKLGTYVEGMKSTDEAIVKYRNEISKLKQEVNSLESISQTEKQKQEVNIELNKHRSYYTSEFAKVTEHETKVKSVNDRIVKTNSDIEISNTELSKLKEELDLYEFWVEGFGSSGVVSYILDAYFPKFNKLLNEYLQVLFGSGIVAKFVPFTTLKSGETREKWDFEIEGLGDYRSCSSGEKRRVDIAVLFSLNALVRDMLGGSNILVVDEVFDPLDDIGCEKTIELLKTLEIPSIFVITHNETLQEKFDKVIFVQKKNGISSVLVE